ncbi:MAG TPA: OmpA family protein [Candidatus Kapabacteria bacterium]|nr:OmpA family protein [Candidatus Kapabacteria bacterium]
MKTFILTMLCVIFCFSCASVKDEPIKVVAFNGFSEIKQHEKAKLNWEFKNAEKVRIENIKRNFNPLDSTDYEVNSTSSIDFTIMNSNDTIKLKWKVVVIDETDSNISTGPDNSLIDFEKPSYIDNEYLNSSIPLKLNPIIRNLKISSYHYNRDNDTLSLSLLIMDDFGNLVRNLSDNSSKSQFATIDAKCEKGEVFNNKYLLTESKFNLDKSLDLALCIDNSAIANDYYPIFKQIQSFTYNINSNDRFLLRTFNQNLQTNLSLQPIKDFNNILKSTKIEKASGLSSIYKNLYKTLNYMNTMKAENEQAIILIAYSSDNSSIVYDRNDVIELAANYNIPIYVIGIGSAVDSYSFKYITEMTGGKYYQIEEKDLNYVYSILTEIDLAKKANYQTKIYFPKENYNECGLLNLGVQLKINNTDLLDSIRIRTMKERQYFNYQAITSFDYKDTIISEQHYETIKSLSMILQNNPDKIIELIGNASIEGSQDEVFNLSLRRAQSVRNKLISNGVAPSQIRVRADGANNPIYYFQDNDWQQYYNRRVELKWLSPELMPYELILNAFESESQALDEVQKWESKSYRVYYERYLQNNIPIYRVKIWGYQTLEDAQRAKNSIERRYQVKLVLQ